MKRFTLRIDQYMYDKLCAMAKYYNIPLNTLIIELAQIGYLVREQEIINEGVTNNEM